MLNGGGPPSVTTRAGTNVAWNANTASRIASNSSIGASMGSVIRRKRPERTDPFDRGDLVALGGYQASYRDGDTTSPSPIVNRLMHDDQRLGGSGLGQPGRCRRADGVEREVQRPVQRVGDPQPHERVRDVRQHGGHEHGRPIGPYHAVPAVQQEREPERAEQAQRHGDDHEHEGVAQRDAEHVVADQLAERVEPDPLRGADEVPLEERQHQSGPSRDDDDEDDPGHERRGHQGERAAVVHRGCQTADPGGGVEEVEPRR